MESTLVRARAQSAAVQQGVGKSKDRALQTHNVFVSFLFQHYILIAEQLAHRADKSRVQRRGRAMSLPLSMSRIRTGSLPSKR